MILGVIVPEYMAILTYTGCFIPTIENGLTGNRADITKAI